MTAPQQAPPNDPEGFEDYSGLSITMQLRLVYDGYGMEAQVSCAVEDIPGVLMELKSMGIKGANTPLLWPEDKPASQQPTNTRPPQQAPPQPQQQQTGWQQNGQPTYSHPPLCPVHGTAMRVSKYEDGGYYCPTRLADGSYCKQKAAAT